MITTPTVSANFHTGEHETQKRIDSIRRSLATVEQCANACKSPEYDYDAKLTAIDDELYALTQLYWVEAKRKGLVA